MTERPNAPPLRWLTWRSMFAAMLTWRLALLAIGAAGLGIIFVWPLHRAVISLCLRFDILDYPDPRKRHDRPTPNIGGVSLFVGLLLALAIVFSLTPAVTGLIAEKLPWGYIVMGALVILAVGVFDDLKPVPPLAKLLAQVLAGLALVGGGLAPDPFYAPFIGEVSTAGWGYLIPIFWVVALSNAVNLIDGLDGLATGMSLIAAVAICLIAAILGAPAVFLWSATLAGALIATLFFNLRPARLFLGDSGALLLGYIFAALSLAAPIKSYTAAALFPPLVALGVPLLETAISFLRRTIRGRSFMVADRRHLFHHLLAMGLSPRATVWVFWLTGLLCASASVAMLFIDKGLAVAALAVAVLVIFVFFFILRLRYARGATRDTENHE